MIDLYYWTTPNGHKITVFLEEVGLDYQIHPIDISKNEQFAPDFLTISPNNRIPAIVDHAPNENKSGKQFEDKVVLFESGSILWYLAQKTGFGFSENADKQNSIMQWLMWQMGGFGPMLGQNHHFSVFAPEKIEYAINRYIKESQRLYGVLDKQLANNRFIIGDDYTIADMACYPWARSHQRQSINLDDFPNVKRWYDAISSREAVLRAYAIVDQFN